MEQKGQCRKLKSQVSFHVKSITDEADVSDTQDRFFGMDTPRGLVSIYFAIYQPGPLFPLIKTEYYFFCVWYTPITQRETLQRERERERRYFFFTGDEVPVTLAGKPVFIFCLVTLPVNSIYCVFAFHGFWIESSTTLSLLFPSFSSSLFHFEAPRKKKKTYVTCEVGFRVRFTLHFL